MVHVTIRPLTTVATLLVERPPDMITIFPLLMQRTGLFQACICTNVKYKPHALPFMCNTEDKQQAR